MLFPLLRRRAIDAVPLDAILQRLEAEHAADMDFAGEFADELQLAADRGHARNPEMLGFMLRGFFEQQRRHVEWENRVLLPIARQVLTGEDLGQLQSWIMASGRPACVRHSVAALRRMPGGSAACAQCDARARLN